MPTVTSEQLLDRMDDAVDALETAVATVTDAADKIGNVSHRVGDETIAGVKTFTSSPQIPTPAVDSNDMTAATTAFVKAAIENNDIRDDGAYVKKAGEGEITGVKTFTQSPLVPTVAASDNSTKAASTGFVHAVTTPVKATAEIAQTSANEAKTLAQTAKTDAANADAKASTCVKKTGDTMTGNLALEKYGAEITITNPGLVLGENPETDLHNRLICRDANGKYFGNADFYVSTTGRVSTNFNAHTIKDGKEVRAFLGINVSSDGVCYGEVSDPPANSVGHEIITATYLNGYAPRKLANGTSIYVGGANASDTADLFAGRGFSADKPFATLTGALNWVTQNCVWGGNISVAIVLQADFNINGLSVYNPNSFITLISDSTKRTITTNGNLGVYSGQLGLRNLKIHADSASELLVSYGGNSADSCLTIYNDVELSGSCAVVASCAKGGTICYYDSSVSLSGDISGKRYAASLCGRIIAFGKADQLPGTEAGTKDASSTVC